MSAVHPFSLDYPETKPAFNKQSIGDTQKEHGWTNGPEKHKDEVVPTLKEEMVDFANNVSILGMKQIVNTKYSPARRLIWLAFVLTGSAFLVFHLWNRIAYYLENPASVDVRFNYNDTIPFPTLTICNNNRFNVAKLSQNGQYNLASFFDYAVTPNFTGYDMDAYNWTAFYINNQYTMVDIAPSYCTFNSEPCLSNLSLVETEMGTCLQFNGEGELKMVDGEGIHHGLTTFLLANQYQYVPFTVTAGFTILLHDRGEVPQLSRLGLQIAPGESVNVAMKQFKVSNLPPPHGQCQDKSLKYFPKYTKLNCEAECGINRTIEKCGCRMHHFADVSDVRVCNPRDLRECDAVNSTAEIKARNCGCTEACRRTHYETSISHSKLSVLFMNTMVAQYNVPASFYAENLIALNIFYSDISVEEVVQQEAYSALTLFADIGGALGLVLGSTLMTAAEIVDFVLGVSLWKLFGLKV
ncbi:acid-sensing ion channel 1C-like [Lingula anatina]|uniref:Acid-sensing ion channel 1C-like n=1 Tax=Lingula anatina TaxID=7574 RepID=A0A1S3IS95_LINAN|nr:acid-sensing ion channel 1C-like [Lingula anatina]|eukprot:XP_013401072.1 acid-sensing ion channel 1C-like [Lingula anatina]